MLRGLVADDDPELRAAVEAALVGAGFQVILAENGRQAIHAVRTMSFDFAVVDYWMPPLNGVEVLATVRQLQPACISVLLSGQLDLPIVTEAVNRGDISRILPKPTDTRTLLRTIEDALRVRREQGQSYMASLMAGKDQVRDALGECLADKLDLAIQPFVHALSRSVMGYEALLRSRHGVLKGPLEVIEAAERCGEVHRLGDAVFRLAGRRLETMAAGLRLFINLHPLEVGDADVFGERLAMLDGCHDRVVFEITERSDLAGVPGWDVSLALIRSKGFQVAVDDLGAGYSSLSALATIKPDFLKVDMSIVRGVDVDGHKRQLLELLAQFSRATGATLIAEGVETPAEADALTACGAHWLQGYLFGRPCV